MRIRIWGSRGSLPAPGASTLEYGGNTSCVELRLDDGTLVILDAGTGIRRLGECLLDERLPSVHVCLTHLHLDHLEGLRFFPPLWQPGTEVHIWGPPSHLMSLEERVARAFSPPLFPVQLTDVPSELTFHDIPNGVWRLGGAAIFAAPVVHPGPTVGYRIEADGRSLAYIPDHEPALGGDLSALPSDWISGADLAERADVLLHDAQYAEDEYPERIGWGHSSVGDAVRFALATRVRRLLLFHHDPSRGDAELERLEQRARELWGRNGHPPELAREGTEIVVS